MFYIGSVFPKSHYKETNEFLKKYYPNANVFVMGRRIQEAHFEAHPIEKLLWCSKYLPKQFMHPKSHVCIAFTIFLPFFAPWIWRQDNDPGLLLAENTFVREKLKLGDKKQMAFAYYINKMVKAGIIVPPYNRDAQGKKVVNYSELARRLLMLFELPADLKNFSAHLNLEKTPCLECKRNKLTRIFIYLIAFETENLCLSSVSARLVYIVLRLWYSWSPQLRLRPS